MDAGELVNNRWISTLLAPVIIAVIAATLFILNKQKLKSANQSQDKPVRNNSGEKKRKSTTNKTENNNKIAPVKKDGTPTKSQTAQEKKRSNEKSSEKLERGERGARATAKPTKKVAPTNASKSLSGAPNAKQTKIINAKTQENGDDFGGDLSEWQTVRTKKQKKQQTQDPLIQAVAEVAAATKGAKSKAPKKKVNEKQRSAKAAVNENVHEEKGGEHSINILNSDDDNWSETKPLKKTKRRALRE